jgi:hypothetical protein
MFRASLEGSPGLRMLRSSHLLGVKAHQDREKLMSEIQILDYSLIAEAGTRPTAAEIITSLPMAGIRKLDYECETAEQAYVLAKQYVIDYEAADRFSHLGEVVGVVRTVEGKYQGLVNTYAAAS